MDDAKNQQSNGISFTYILIGIIGLVCFTIAAFFLLHAVSFIPQFPFVTFEKAQITYPSYLTAHSSNQFLSQTITPLPTAAIPLESCTIKQKDSPFVGDVSESNTVIAGDYQGIIKTITIDTLRKTVSITLTSRKGNQTHVFTVNATIPVYDGTHVERSSFASLKTGQLITIAFNCNKKKGTGFQIVTVGIENN